MRRDQITDCRAFAADPYFGGDVSFLPENTKIEISEPLNRHE